MGQKKLTTLLGVQCFWSFHQHVLTYHGAVALSRSTRQSCLGDEFLGIARVGNDGDTLVLYFDLIAWSLSNELRFLYADSNSTIIITPCYHIQIQSCHFHADLPLATGRVFVSLGEM